MWAGLKLLPLASLLAASLLLLSAFSLSAQSSEWTAARGTLLGHLRTAEAELEKASRQLSELQGTLALSRRNSQDLSKSLSEQREELIALSNEIETLRGQLADSLETSTQLRDRVDRLLTRLSALNSQLDELSESFEEYRRRTALQTISAGVGGVVVGALIGLLLR